MAELGLAASVDYCDDKESSTMLLDSDNDDDDDDSNAPIVPIGLTPTSSPEQLPHLLSYSTNHCIQPIQSQRKESHSSDMAAKPQQDLSNIGNLEVFALK